jgi:hypothetical protein
MFQIEKNRQSHISLDNTLDSMVRRALIIRSSYSVLSTVFNEIQPTRKLNGYLQSFIDVQIDVSLIQCLSKNESKPSQMIDECETKQMYIELPFIGLTNQTTKSLFEHLSKKLGPPLNVHIYTKPPPYVQKFSPCKDPITKHMQSSIVYYIKYNNCSQSCIRKTERKVIRRMCEYGALKFVLPNNKHQQRCR